MTNEDERIRDALWPEAETAADPRFTAALLYRLGRRRRLARHAVRLLILAGTVLVAAIMAPVVLPAFASLGPRIDGPTLATGLILLFACAMLSPARA